MNGDLAARTVYLRVIAAAAVAAAGVHELLVLFVAGVAGIVGARMERTTDRCSRRCRSSRSPRQGRQARAVATLPSGCSSRSVRCCSAPDTCSSRSLAERDLGHKVPGAPGAVDVEELAAPGAPRSGVLARAVMHDMRWAVKERHGMGSVEPLHAGAALPHVHKLLAVDEDDDLDMDPALRAIKREGAPGAERSTPACHGALLSAIVVYRPGTVHRTARPGAFRARNEAILKTERYDVFLAAPMSALGSEAEYQESRGRMVALITHMQARHRLERVYYAGLRASSGSEFTSPEVALAEDMSALRSTGIFVLIYPSKIVSSVLVEVGYAMALNKPCLLLARRRDDLPYLLLSAEGLSGTHGLPFLQVITYRDDDDLPGALDTGIPAALAALSEPIDRAESLATAPTLPTRAP